MPVYSRRSSASIRAEAAGVSACGSTPSSESRGRSATDRTSCTASSQALSVPWPKKTSLPASVSLQYSKALADCARGGCHNVLLLHARQCNRCRDLPGRLPLSLGIATILWPSDPPQAARPIISRKEYCRWKSTGQKSSRLSAKTWTDPAWWIHPSVLPRPLSFSPAATGNRSTRSSTTRCFPLTPAR